MTYLYPKMWQSELEVRNRQPGKAKATHGVLAYLQTRL
jgi:hypothetical protein